MAEIELALKEIKEALMAEPVGSIWPLYHAVPRYPDRPKVVCICGSTRFYQEYQDANKLFTLEGVIVLTVGFYPHQVAEGITDEVKDKLDELHLRKIDLADFIFVLNRDGYIGPSTQREIEYAKKFHKPVMYLEP